MMTGDTNSSLSTRVAGPGDVAVLSATGSKVFWDAYGGTALDKDIALHVESYFSEAAVAAEIVQASVTYLIAEQDGECAGLVKIRDSQVPAKAVAATAMEVQQLYVATAFQRRGVGGLLMDAAVSLARQQSIDGIWLSVWEDAPWATSFYTKYGFESLGEVPFLLGATEFVDYIMWLPVGD